MKQVNLYEAKTHLSALVDEAAAGEEIVIAKNGKARAKLTMVDAPTKATSGRKRPPPRFGFWNHYGWKLPDNFDDPDPEIEALFYDGPVFPDDKA
jgi:prevent-host-death family protein